MSNAKRRPAVASKTYSVPAYISDLIRSINDDAGKARSTALALLLTGLYLAATVIATTDEAMLRGSSREIPQIGVALPVVISYALAPLVFLFLHVSTLILFERVAQKLIFYLEELRQTVPEASREHCNNLLTGTAFVQGLARLNDSDNGGRRLFRFMSWLTVAGLPVAVLLAVQIDFVRYQQTTINLFQKTILVADLLLLSWFYLRIMGRGKVDSEPIRGASRAPEDGSAGASTASSAATGAAGLRKLASYAANQIGEWMPSPSQALQRLRRSWGFIVLAAVTLWLGFGHANVPGPDAETVGRRTNAVFKSALAEKGELRAVPQSIWRGENVLDGVLCPIMGWGCRYLRLNNLALLEGTVERESMLKIEAFANAEDPDESQASNTVTNQHRDLKSALRLVDGLFLGRRTLRFADFTGSKLYRAVLIGADLRHATLTNARLQGADLRSAMLERANLNNAQLQGADLRSAMLKHAELTGARLGGADLRGAMLEHADLRRARLQRADLRNANLNGADLGGAWLQRADFRAASLQDVDFSGLRLQGANLRRIDLQGANLSSAMLQGADLSGAKLQGANLEDAQLHGANLRRAQLQGANLQGSWLQGADLRYAELQGADLKGARLQGANLREARLQGANLEDTQLQGANLRVAQLQGANLKNARLRGADLREANIRGAHFSTKAELGYADLRRARLGRLTDDDFAEFEIALASLDAIKRGYILATFELRVGMNDNLRAARLAVAYCAGTKLTGCGVYISVGKYYDAQSASVLETFACDGVVVLAVARAMARRAMEIGIPFKKTKSGNWAPYWHLAKALLDKDECAGHKHLTQETIRQLQEFTKLYNRSGD